MARARTIKPGFFQNEQLGELPPLCRLAFIGLWTVADFKGCVEWRPKKLKAQLLPYDNCDFDEILNNLESSGLIASYTVYDKKYCEIINFRKHQNPHKNESEAGSEIPDNPNSRQIEKNHEENGTTPAVSLILDPDPLNPLPPSPIRGQATDAVATEFDALWSRYPKRAGGNSRKEALAAYRASRKRHTPEVIAAGLERYRAFIEATGKVGTEYVKQAASFFGPKDHFLESWDAPTGKRATDPFAGMVNK